MGNRPRIYILIIAAAVLAALAALIWELSIASRSTPVTPRALPQAAGEPPAAPSATPTGVGSSASPLPTPSDSPVIDATPTPNARSSTPVATPSLSASPTAGGAPAVGTLNLIIPVAGVRPDQLQDTFTAARAQGRTHDAIDIPAPHNTPVLAAADGRIIKLFQSKPGGTTIYQLGTDNKTVYYYAHLDHYAEGLTEGHFARQGEVIAYVGDTGDAGPGNYHLHFSISIVSDPKRYWEGVNINPYPLLRK